MKLSCYNWGQDSREGDDIMDLKLKIVGIVVIILLITTLVVPVSGLMKEYTIDSNETPLTLNYSSENINQFEMQIKKTDYLFQDDIEIMINPSQINTLTTSNDPFHIYEGLQWKLHISTSWDPPQPEKQICLWANTMTLPMGAIFPECQCDFGSVTSTLEWTPSIGQAGTYQIMFYVGENCYEQVGYFIITVIVHPSELDPQKTFEIPVGQEWHLQLTASWDPPQPEKIICLWVDLSTLPYGATFTECHCDYGQVTSDLYWTPTYDQLGEHIITFLVGENCGYYRYPYPILCNVVEPECHDRPILTDNSGETTFHGVIVGVNHDNDGDDSTTLQSAEYSAQKMREALLKHEGWDEDNVTLLTGDNANADDIEEAIEEAKQRARPGDEFLFYFANHGDKSEDDDGDETDGDGEDGSLWANDYSIKDDDLKDWLSGFPYCVTITVKLDCCYSGEFIDDLKQAINSNDTGWDPPDRYGDHINIETSVDKDSLSACDNIFYWEDENNDGIVDVERGELKGPCGHPLNDPSKVWYDKNEDGIVQNDEIFEPDDPKIKTFFNWTRANLEGIGPAEDTITSNYGFTKADRNRDGITTSKELYEYAVNFQYEQLSIDNDKDGLINEDGIDLIRVNGATVRQYIDNDGDGLIDEDHGPGDPQYWYNYAPEKPTSINGPNEGKKGETYTYSTSSMDSDNDDIFFLFDWDDGTNTGWLGPFDSGDTCSASHIWNNQGSYQIKVIARDRCFSKSDWTTMEVTMPKTRSITDSMLKIIENYPFLHQILNFLL